MKKVENLKYHLRLLWVRFCDTGKIKHYVAYAEFKEKLNSLHKRLKEFMQNHKPNIKINNKGTPIRRFLNKDSSNDGREIGSDG